MTSPSAADIVSTRSLEEHDADVYAGYLRDLRQELQEPPEFVFYDEHPPALRSGRECVIRDCLAVWFD